MSCNNDTINEHKPISNTTLNRLTVVPFFHQKQRRGGYPHSRRYASKYGDIIKCMATATTPALMVMVLSIKANSLTITFLSHPSYIYDLSCIIVYLLITLFKRMADVQICEKAAERFIKDKE